MALLYNDDCLKIMEKIPSKSIDMILCDLPYGTTRNKWDVTIPLGSIWGGYSRVIKENGAIVLFCDGMFMANLMLSNQKMWRYNLIWDKQKGNDFLNANVKPLKSHEEIAIFYKKKPTYNKQYWYSKTYKDAKSGRQSTNYGEHHSVISKSIDGRRNPLTVLSFPHDAKKFHPTQKPVPLLEWLIKTYTNCGETVLDNCMGSGSTGVACVKSNRNFIGIELDEGYFNIAKERIEKAEGENNRKRLDIL